MTVTARACFGGIYRGRASCPRRRWRQHQAAAARGSAATRAAIWTGMETTSRGGGGKEGVVEGKDGDVETSSGPNVVFTVGRGLGESVLN